MGDSGANGGVGTLEVSVSFGRFEKDSLCWEKWSAFPTNKYLEEVEKCSTPGSVAQKAAYFEAHYKKIAARKIEQLQDQDRKNQWDEEINREEDSKDQRDRASEKLVQPQQEELRLGNKLDVVENENYVVEGGKSDAVEIDNCFVEGDTGSADLKSEVDDSQMVVEPIDNVDKMAHELESASAPAQPAVDVADVEDESCCSDDSMELLESDEVMVEEELINPASEVADSLISEPCHDLSTAKESSKEGSPPRVEGAKEEPPCVATSKELHRSEDVPPAKEEAPEVESQESVRSPMSVINKARGDAPKDIAQKPKHSPRSQKITPGKAGTSSAISKKTPISSRPKSPLISSASKISNKPSLSRSFMSESKKAPTLPRSAMPESRHAPQAFSRSVMPESKQVPALSKSVLSESKAKHMCKKENGLSLPSKKSTTIRVESRRTVPTSLHTSLNLDSANCSSTTGSAVRKSLIMERMGDKDIVKRAFKAFQKNFNQLSVSSVDKPDSTSPGSEKVKKPKGLVVGTPPKKSEGLIKSVKKASPCVGQSGLRKASVSPGSPNTLHSDQRSVRPVSFSSPYNLRSHDKPHKPKEVAQKLENRPISKAVEKPRLLNKAKVEKKETDLKKLPAERNHTRTKTISSSFASKSSTQKMDGKS